MKHQRTDDPPTPHQYGKLVKSKAAELGFDACHFARAGLVDPENRLGAWLAAGYHADMEWMARTALTRQDPAERLPGAASVVVLAKNYHAPRPDSLQRGGRVSCYAWGRDYHRVLRKPLRQLARFVESLQEGAATAGCIDSGPVLEKFWAARAGLGWIGKNSLVLRRDLGSYIFLAVLITTVELPPDAPTTDCCGSCRACVDACPMGAIVEDRIVDSARCISYQTIENRGEIPVEIANAMGDWAFGCDICQEVCPWNRKAPITQEHDFHARPGHSILDPEWVREMDEETFRQEFSGTPILRAKYTGIQRNVGIVAANQAGDKESAR